MIICNRKKTKNKIERLEELIKDLAKTTLMKTDPLKYEVGDYVMFDTVVMVQSNSFQRKETKGLILSSNAYINTDYDCVTLQKNYVIREIKKHKITADTFNTSGKVINEKDIKSKIAHFNLEAKEKKDG